MTEDEQSITDILKQEEKQIHEYKLDTLRKYVALKIKPNTEARLRRQFQKEESEDTKSFVLNEVYINNIILALPKQKRAERVFKYCQDCKQLSSTILCSKFGISGSYYRELRAINKKQWHSEYLETFEDNFIDVIVFANDNTISDAEYRKFHGKDYDRQQWRV